MREVDETEQGTFSEDQAVEITDLDPPDRLPSRVLMMPRRLLATWGLPRFRRRRRIVGGSAVILLTLLVIVALSGGALFAFVGKSFSLESGARSLSQRGQSIDPVFVVKNGTLPDGIRGQNGMACLADAQWSPDGRAVAVLGYQNSCPRNNDEAGILNIYSARTGKLSAQWQLDDTIIHVLNAPYAPGSPSQSPTVTATSTYRTGSGSQNVGGNRIILFSYQRVLWSPDGQRLAVTFIALFQQRALHGLLLMHVDGTHTEVTLQPPGVNQGLQQEWDLASGQAIPFASVSPALAYRWGSGGTLVPETPLSDHSIAPTVQSGPIGNPDGSSAFSIWQPGYAALTNISGMSVWSTTFAAWSPGGRYLIDGLSLLGLMNPVGHALPDAQTLAALRLQHYSLLAPRDAALEHVAFQSPIVAWRPDGRVLATYNYYNLALFDCQTGKLLTILNLTDEAAPLLGSTALLRWSPDGSHLLLSSAYEGVLNIWGPGKLPG